MFQKSHLRVGGPTSLALSACKWSCRSCARRSSRTTRSTSRRSSLWTATASAGAPYQDLWARNAAGPAVSLPGDLWLLGKHRVYCGSALDPLAYELLMAKERASAVFADPPYNVKIDGNVCGSGAVKHREFAMASGEMTREEFARFLAGAFDLARAYASPGAIIYACMDWRHMAEMLAAGDSANFELLNLCVWVKTNGGMGSLYRSRHELVLCFATAATLIVTTFNSAGSAEIGPTSGLRRRQHFQAKRAQERSRLASNRQTDRHGRRRDFGFNRSRRRHHRPLSRRRHDLARRRTRAGDATASNSTRSTSIRSSHARSA